MMKWGNKIIIYVVIKLIIKYYLCGASVIV